MKNARGLNMFADQMILMKVEEVALFNIHEPISDEFVNHWKSASSHIVANIRRTVDGDDFLRKNLDELRIEWKYDTKKESIFYGHAHRQYGRVYKDLGINIASEVCTIHFL